MNWKNLQLHKWMFFFWVGVLNQWTLKISFSYRKEIAKLNFNQISIINMSHYIPTGESSETIFNKTISEINCDHCQMTKCNKLYDLEYSNYCLYLCFIHNLAADVLFSFLQVFLVKLRNLNRTSNKTLYLIHDGKLFKVH